MEGLIVLAVLAALTAWAARPLRRHTRDQAAALGLAPDDVAELNAAARRILLEHYESNATLLRRTRMLQLRGVPLRRIEPTPFSERWTLGFADGTSLLVSALNPATVIAMRLEMTTRTLALHRILLQERGLELEFTGGRKAHRVYAVSSG